MLNLCSWKVQDGSHAGRGFWWHRCFLRTIYTIAIMKDIAWAIEEQD
jgi:hypothetical protein